MLRPSTIAILVLPGVLSGWLACSVPSDSNTYQYAADGVSLGLACDPAHPCGEELLCRTPAVCTRGEDVVAPGPDATPPEPGAGGLGDRCEDGGGCAAPYDCEPLSETAVCTADCSVDTDCPEGGQCWLEPGPSEGACVRPGGLIGDACDVENDCAPGLFCENRAAGGYCSMRCGRYAPCPAGMDAVCTKLSGDFGNYCLKRCSEAEEQTGCREDVGCRKMTKADVWVCFPSF